MGISEPLDPEAGPECLCSPTGRAVMVNGVSVTPPKVYSGPGLSLHTAGLFLLLSTRLGLTLLWDGGQHPIPQSSDPCPAAPPHPESLPLVQVILSAGAKGQAPAYHIDKKNKQGQTVCI